MALTFYNTLTQQQEEFNPLQPPRVGLYTCGPTVYDYAHIGNLRAFLFSDLLRRVLERRGYQVTQVMNITDVDDKTIKASHAAGCSLRDFTRRYEELFLNDLAVLNIRMPHHRPRASEHIPEMVALVEKLLAAGLAYRAEDGVYFRLAGYPRYGVLSPIARRETQQERIRNDEYDKENARDFALWKFQVPEDGEVVWQTSLGRGRPGWHIECSAMSTKYLGSHFDLHTGGLDLIFPHHENEIVQSSILSGDQPVANYWLHSGFVNVNGQKMSKSLGNILRLADLGREGISPPGFRFWVLSAHYRQTINFTIEAGRAAETAYGRLTDQFLSWPAEAASPLEPFVERFDAAIDDDLNTPQALAVLWELVRDERSSPSAKRATLLVFDEVLGLGLATAKLIEIPPPVAALVAKREEARRSRNWSLADQLRAEVAAAGFLIEDTDQGPKIKPEAQT